MSFYPGAAYNPYVQPVLSQPILTQSFTQPVYAPVLNQSVVQAPILTQSVFQAPIYAQPAVQTIKGESRTEFVEYERPEIEYITETREVVVPRTKMVKDHYPVEYQTEYVPRTVYETQTEYVSITKTVPRTEYEAVERQPQQPAQVVQQPVVVPQPVQYVRQPVIQQNPLSYSLTRPFQYVPAPVQYPVQGYIAPITQSIIRRAPGSQSQNNSRPNSNRPANQAQQHQKKEN